MASSPVSLLVPSRLYIYFPHSRVFFWNINKVRLFLFWTLHWFSISFMAKVPVKTYKALYSLFHDSGDFALVCSLLHVQCIEESMAQSRCLINICWLNLCTCETEATSFRKYSLLFELGAPHSHCGLCSTHYVLSADQTSSLLVLSLVWTFALLCHLPSWPS